MIAFVLGNGRSRYKIDHKKLFDYGVVFACNAAYRDVKPNYLISVDIPMIQEILDKSEYKDNFYIPKYIQNANKYNCNSFDTQCEGITDSGNFACMLACNIGYTKIYMIGFDYISMNYYQNNVYTGTENYRRKNHKHTLPESIENWYNKANIMIERYKHINFIRINANDYEPPIYGNNFINITLEQFNELFPDTVDFDIIVPEGYQSDVEIKQLEKRIRRLERNNDAVKKHMARLQKIKEKSPRPKWTRRTSTSSL